MGKILLITPNFPPETGGIQTLLHEVAGQLFQDIIVLAPAFPESELWDENQPYRVERIPFASPKTFHRAKLIYRHSLQIAAREKISAIHCGHAAFAWACKRVGNKLKVPVILYSYGMEIFGLSRGLKAAFHRRYVRQADWHLTISRHTQDMLVRICAVDPRRVSIFPLGVDQNRFKSNLDVSSLAEKLKLRGKKILLTVGRLVARKGHALVIRAMPEIVKQEPKAVYLIAGKGPEEHSLKELVKELGLEKSVLFAGFVPDADLPGYYNLCEVFIMMSSLDEAKNDVEGFGLVYLEAYACGKPVIGSSRGGGAMEAVKTEPARESTGLLADPAPASVASACLKLFGDETLRDQMAENGRRWLAEEMNWKHAAAVISQSPKGQEFGR